MAADGSQRQIADPTIAQALDRYLAAEQKRLKPRTYARYADVIELLTHSLNSYGPNRIDPTELDHYEQAGYDIEAEDPPFCEVFGPAVIPDHLSEFLSYFLPRKVAAGEDFLKSAGTVTRKLSRWLAEQGYVDQVEARLAEDTGATASRDLPAARRLVECLQAPTSAAPVRDDDIEGYFEVRRVEAGRLWLIDFLDGRDYGPVDVPEDASALCRAGWQIAGALAPHGQGYRLVDAYNVYT